MTFMLCRTRVKDYPTWKAVFDSHADAHRAAAGQAAGVVDGEYHFVESAPGY